MRIISKITLSLLCAFTLVLAGCDKHEPYDIATVDQIHFNGAMKQFVNIEDPTTPPITIEVGTTHLPKSDVTFTYQISSPTGATSGVEYVGPSSGTMTIPAGETLTSFEFQPVSSAYGPPPDGDTIYITFSQSSVPASPFGDTVTLIVRRCSDAFADVNELVGTFNNTTDFFLGSGGGPYTTTVTGASPLTATSGSITVQNLLNSDTEWGNVSFILDWSDPANPTTVVIPGEVPGSDAGDINTPWAGFPFVVADQITGRPALSGSFSYCNQSITLKMYVGFLDDDGNSRWITYGGGTPLTLDVTLQR